MRKDRWGSLKEILIAGVPDKIGNYRRAVEALGAVSRGLYTCSWEEAEGCDALLLPGGGDIAPELFGQKDQGSREVDEILDRMQLRILDSYIRRKKPVLGICKGMQIINTYYGGTIKQHLKTAHFHEYRNGDQYHMTIARKGSILETLYGLRFPVNSAHHQGIDRLGEHLQAIQFAEDRVIEGIVHEELPVIGVQWHPERMPEPDEDCADGRRLLEYWLKL